MAIAVNTVVKTSEIAAILPRFERCDRGHIAPRKNP